jgi:hypothetical protein
MFSYVMLFWGGVEEVTKWGRWVRCLRDMSEDGVAEGKWMGANYK